MKRVIPPVCLAICCLAFAQEQPAATPQKKTPIAQGKKKPAVDSDNDRGLQILARAETEVLKMEPKVKSGLCLEILSAYRGTVEREDVVRVANECFRAALEIDDNAELRLDRQLRAVDALAGLTPEVLSDFEQVADPEVRSRIEGILFTHEVHAKHYDDALERVSTLGHMQSFPFDAAANLMSSLPSERSADKLAVFYSALQSYRQFPDTREDSMPRHNDIATLILQFWRQLPSRLVEESIDDVLKNAGEASKNHPTSLTLKNPQGQIGFDSPYQMRLFELLPVLRELNNTKAEKLLSESGFLTKIMDRYPDGLRSFEPSYADDSGMTQNAMSIGYSSSSAAQLSMMAMNDELRTIDDIVGLADSDPKTAFAKARGLPHWPDLYGSSPRAQAMDGIAQETWKTDPDIAKSALKELVSSTDFLDTSKRVPLLLDAISDYWGLDDKPSAMRTAASLSRMARDLYREDTRGKGNLAVKLEWPSTAVWKIMVVLESRFHPGVFPPIINQVQDDEIQWSLQIEFAKGLLGRPSHGVYVRKKMEEQFPGSYQYIEIPAFKSQ